ncbi:MAG: hypothetical protein Q8S33_09705 [Myxococcales bacterium]|nr:hypothetical protein [Myxococcales bacterium]
MVVTRQADAASFEALRGRLDALWKVEQVRSPSLASARAEVVGESILQAIISEHLVPTLTESFGLTALSGLRSTQGWRAGRARSGDGRRSSHWYGGPSTRAGLRCASRCRGGCGVRRRRTSGAARHSTPHGPYGKYRFEPARYRKSAPLRPLRPA